MRQEPDAYSKVKVKVKVGGCLSGEGWICTLFKVLFSYFYMSSKVYLF